MVYPVVAGMDEFRAARIHRFAVLWQIDRTDGTTLRFTGHDRPIVYQGNEFSPLQGFDSSAKQFETSMRESDFEVRGILSDSRITYDDLRARRYDDAKVTEFLVDWRYASVVGVPIRKKVFYIAETEYDGAQWRGRVVSLASRLRKVLGRTLAKQCYHELGDDRCQVNLESAANKWTTTVESLVAAGRKIFVVPTNAFANNHFTQGRCTFVDGANAGLTLTVAAYASATRRIYLLHDAPLIITAGDSIVLRAGCDLIKDSDCKNKFNNVVNFGGFPFMPGTNKAAPIKV